MYDNASLKQPFLKWLPWPSLTCFIDMSGGNKTQDESINLLFQITAILQEETPSSSCLCKSRGASGPCDDKKHDCGNTSFSPYEIENESHLFTCHRTYEEILPGFD